MLNPNFQDPSWSLTEQAGLTWLQTPDRYFSDVAHVKVTLNLNQGLTRQYKMQNPRHRGG